MSKINRHIARLCALCPLLLAGATYATSVSWTHLCDFNWNNEIIDMNNGGEISPLDLITSQQIYVEPVEIWCHNIPNDTTTTGQEVDFEVTEQSPSTGTTLALSPVNSELSANTLPFEVCLGDNKSKVPVECVSEKGITATYNWGGDGNASLAPFIFETRKSGDPEDECDFWGGGEQSCVVDPLYRGPYNNIAHIRFITTPTLIAATPPAPGDYVDTVTASINGNVGTEVSAIPSVDLSGENNPTIYLKASLKPDCRINSAPDVLMNGSFSKKLSQQQQIVVTCTNTTPYTMSFTGDNDHSGWHQMKSDKSGDNDMLRYQIYSDSAHTQPWSNTTSLTGNGRPQTYNLYYATDPKQANLPAGTYQDTETLTVSY